MMLVATIFLKFIYMGENRVKGVRDFKIKVEKDCI
jgi:hypothetical protein